jgi:AcrR family transcriptional regulator
MHQLAVLHPRGREAWAPEPRRFSTRQEEVLDVIEAVFLRDGIRSVRIGQLASEARCSRSTLYELAPSKEELLLLVLDRLMRRIARRGSEAIKRQRRPVDQIRAIFDSGALDFAPLGATFMQAVQDYRPARWLFDRHIEAARAVLEDLIRDAINARQFRPVNARVAAEALFVVVLRFTDPEFVRSAGVSSSSALSEFFDLMINGLRAPA